MSQVDLQPSDHRPLPPPVEPPLKAAPAADWLAAEAPALRTVLRRLRRRAASVAFWREALLGAAAAVGVLLLCVLLVALKQSWARNIGWGLGAVAVVAGIVRGFWRASKLRSDDLAAARALGSVAPHEASDLVSAVELARDAARSDSGLSAGLVRAHVARMEAIAARLDPRSAIHPRPVLLAAAIVTGLLVVHVALHGLGSERLREAYAFLAFRTTEKAPLFAPEPIAGDISLTYKYPAHMNRPPRTVPGTAGDISAPKGTIIELSARADRDVERAFAVIQLPGKEPQTIPLEVKGRLLTGQLLVSDPGEWAFRYSRASGSTVAEGPGRPIAIEPDVFPEVKLTAPEAELEISGKETITLGFNASDDYGLSQVELVWNRGRGVPEERRPLVNIKDAPRHLREEVSWDLSALGAQPGDRITYRIEAFDNDSVAGKKKGVSASQTLKVFSASEHNRELLKKMQEQWERLVNGLGDRLEEPGPGDAGERANSEWENKYRPKDEFLATVARDMRALAKTLGADPHAPPELGRALANVGSRLAPAVERTSARRSSLLRQPSGATASSFRAALAEEIREEERGVLYLEDLMDRRRLLDLQEMTRELQKGRQELAKLVEQYKKSPDEATKQRIMAEVARLKERLHDLYRRMQELSREIQDEHLNQEAQQMMDEGEDMMSQLDKIQQQLSKGDGDQALKELEKLQAQLEKMEKQFGDKAGETTEEQKKIGEDLQKLASDLMDLQAEQQALKKQTDDLRQKSRDAAQQKLKQLGQEFVEKQLDRLKRARSELKSIDSKSLERFGDDEMLQRVDDRISELEKALKAGDFDEAADQAQEAAQYQRDLAMRLSYQAEAARQPYGLFKDPQKAQESSEHASKAGKPIQDVADDLDKLMKKARTPPTEAEQQAMRDLQRKQGQLERQSEQLQQKMDELGKQMPMFGPGQQKLLQEAAGQMGEAGEKLGQTDPRGASARQQQALQKLQALRDAMQKGGQSSGGPGGIPMPFAGGGEEGDGDQEGGQGFQQQKVEIPNADQNKAPDEFRKDILDAMKDKAPEKYKERVRDYYEELVK
jgi:hypothetical protein